MTGPKSLGARAADAFDYIDFHLKELRMGLSMWGLDEENRPNREAPLLNAFATSRRGATAKVKRLVDAMEAAHRALEQAQLIAAEIEMWASEATGDGHAQR